VLPPPVTVAVSVLAGPTVPFAQAGTRATNGGLAAFLGVTALVLTGFLVLARLSQRVVDDAEASEDGERVRVPGPAPGEPTPGGPAGDDSSDSHPSEHAGTAEDASARQADARSIPGDVDQSPAAGTAGNDGAGAVTTVDGTRAGPDAGEELASVPPGALLANVALTQGLFGGVLAAAAWFFQVPAPALGLAGGRVTGLAAVGVGLAFGLVLWLGNEAASALADATGAGYDEGLRQLLAPADARGWAVLLGGVLPVVALVEEFIFRAAAVGAASAALAGTGGAAGPWALAAGSSLLFALGHGAQGRVGVAVTGALGFVLAAGFLLSGSFLVVVVAHYVVNALEFLVHEAAGLPDPVWA
jgi:membrane protease YdiL (CAAX protease family)